METHTKPSSGQRTPGSLHRDGSVAFVVEVETVNQKARKTEWREIARYGERGSALYCASKNTHCNCRVREEKPLNKKVSDAPDSAAPNRKQKL